MAFTKAGRYDEVLLRNPASTNSAVKAVTDADVYVFEEDGTTAATLYADSDKTGGAEADHIVSPDANGNLEFFANPGTYVLKIYVDSVLERTDTVIVPPDPDEMEDSGEGVANVTTYGAVGDGVTDDTTAIQAALDAGDTFLPEGTYKITSSLTITDAGRHFYGNGKIKRAASVVMLQISVDDVVVRGIEFDGDNTAGSFTGTAIEISTADDTLIDDIGVTDTGGTCIEFTTVDRGVRAKVINSILDPASGSVAIKMPAGDATVGGQSFVNVSVPGGLLADFGGCDNIRVTSCNMLRLGTFRADSVKVTVTGSRIASGGTSDTILGVQHALTGNIIAGDLVIDATAGEVVIVGNVSAGTITDNTSNSVVVANRASGQPIDYAALTGATFTGPVSVPDGTAAIPRLRFADEINTGIIRPSAGRIGLTIQGIESYQFQLGAFHPPSARDGLISLGVGGARWNKLLLAGKATLDSDLDVAGDVSIGGGKPWFDVTHPDFGAVGDGVTDDAAAIQAAIDAAETAGGGTVFIPKASYAVATSLVVAGPLTLVLQPGTTITQIGASRPRTLDIRNASNVTVWGYGATIDQDATALTGSHCVAITGSCTNISVYGMKATGAGRDGFAIGTFPGDAAVPEGVRLYDCIADGNNRIGFFIMGCKDVVLTDCRGINNAGTAPEAGFDIHPESDPSVSVNRLQGVRLVRPYTEGNGSSGVRLVVDHVETEVDIVIDNHHHEGGGPAMQAFSFLTSTWATGRVLYNEPFIVNATRAAIVFDHWFSEGPRFEVIRPEILNYCSGGTNDQRLDSAISIRCEAGAPTTASKLGNIKIVEPFIVQDGTAGTSVRPLYARDIRTTPVGIDKIDFIDPVEISGAPGGAGVAVVLTNTDDDVKLSDAHEQIIRDNNASFTPGPTNFWATLINDAASGIRTITLPSSGPRDITVKQTHATHSIIIAPPAGGAIRPSEFTPSGSLETYGQGSRVRLVREGGDWWVVEATGLRDRRFSLLEIDGALDHDGSTAGFYGTAPVAKAGSTADIKDSLVALGLITDAGATPLNLDGGALTVGDATLTGNLKLPVALWVQDSNNANRIFFTSGSTTLFQAARTTSDLFVFRDSAGTVRLTIGATGLDVPDALTVGGDLNHDGTNVGFFGTAPAPQPAAYTPTNVTTDRAYDANATTLDELADVVGTLVADLQSLGLIG